MKKDEKKSAMSTSQGKKGEDDALDRDQPGPVSVSPKDKKKPSYTHNADESDPIDPHLSEKKKPKPKGGDKEEDSEEVLDRDQPGPVSVSPKDKDKPSYTHNADETDPIDPNLVDQSGHSKKKKDK